MLDADDLVIVRDLKFRISKHKTRRWLDNDVYKTALIDCFAALLPKGERFFIRSLRHHAKDIQNPALLKEIKGYSAQEGLHTREHEDYNAALRALGYNIDRIEQRFHVLLNDEVTDPVDRLALTCAIEQVTAAFAMATLRRPKIMETAATPYRRIWTWHALEELEHSTAAVHVLREVMADASRWRRYRVRTRAMTLWIRWLIAHQIDSMFHYVAVEKGRPNTWQFFLGCFRAFLLSPGYARLSILPVLYYYMPWFDPDRQLDLQLVARGRAMLKDELDAWDQEEAVPAE